MTIQEAAKEIETQSLLGIWRYASAKARLAFIEGIISAITEEPEQAAKKVKQRKPRKPKQVPLTQHAEASDSAGPYTAYPRG